MHVLFLLLPSLSNALFGYSQMTTFRGHSFHIQGSGDAPFNTSVQELYYANALTDHNAPTSQKTFWKQRYFLNDEFYGGKDFPIFLYIGGEGPLTSGVLSERNYIYTAARTHRALLVAVEHRFYGRSYPTVDMSTDNLRLLSSEQALADLARFHSFLTTQLNLEGHPWVAFGGSYPGALAAWFKLKYPSLVVGSIASSAPILAQEDFREYVEVVGNSLRYFGGGKCYTAVQEAMVALHALVATVPNGHARLDTLFNPCYTMENELDESVFESTIMGYFQGITQYNTLRPDAMTVSQVCEMFTSGKHPLDTLAAFVAKNREGNCTDSKFDGAVNSTIEALRKEEFDGVSSSRQWVYQTCNEFGYFQNAASPHSPFFPLKTVSIENMAYIICERVFNMSLPDIQSTNLDYGALGITVENVTFPSGTIDPWHVLAVQNNTHLATKSSHAVFIEGTAHCADMRAPSLSDIPALQWAHDQIGQAIHHLHGEDDIMSNVPAQWIHESTTTEWPVLLFLSSYRFHVTPLPSSSLPEVPPGYFTAPLGSIATIVKKTTGILIVKMKDFRIWTLRLASIRITQVEALLLQMAFFKESLNCFAFHHKLPQEITEIEPLPPYSLHMEWERITQLRPTARDIWRISSINNEYQMIPSYPSHFLVPQSIDDHVLMETVQFRSKGRIPVLSWLHPISGTVLCRCSQPRIGLSQATSSADVRLLLAIAEISTLSNTLQIIDARPRSSAMANHAKGYGVENTAQYPFCTISFLNIQNIHAVRDSYQKVGQLCLSSNMDNLNWWSSVEDTKWLFHIRTILKGAVQCASYIQEGTSLLVHCSHGWDRTSQLTSLIQLLVDPFFRSITGFQILIEKEWFSFGHPFELRQCIGKKEDSQYSPIFLQFLDCVYQLITQYPSYFGFNSVYLIMLATQLNSNRFGTFLYSCEKDRVASHVKTNCIWKYLRHYHDLVCTKIEKDDILIPNLSSLLRGVTFWSELHMRWSVQNTIISSDSSQHPSVLKVVNERDPNWQLPHSIIEVIRNNVK